MVKCPQLLRYKLYQRHWVLKFPHHFEQRNPSCLCLTIVKITPLILNEFSNIFFMIFNCKKNLVWHMMSIIFSTFFFQVLDKLDLDILYSWLFI